MDAAVFLTLILCLLNGGNDLLDYLDTEQYWQIKNVPVTLQAMTAELQPPKQQDVSQLIPELEAADAPARDEAGRKIRKAGASALEPLRAASRSGRLELSRRAGRIIEEIHGDLKPVEVRRLMAIRALGELGKKDALPILQPFLDLKEPFVADYARTAVGLIEAKPVVRPRPLELIRNERWLLPGNCFAVGQLTPREGKPVSVAKGIELIRIGRGGDRNDMINRATRQIVVMAEEIGNVRVESATFGTFEGEEKAPVLVVFGRVQCDAEGFRGLARRHKLPMRQVQGVDVFEPSRGAAILIPSDDQVIVIGAMGDQGLPVERTIEAIKSNKGGLAEATSMKKLIEKVDTALPLWVVGEVTETYRRVPVVEAFDTFSLFGRRDGDALALTLEAKGHDPEKAKAAAEALARYAEKGIKEINPIVTVAPILSAAVDLLGTVKVSSAGDTLTATATLKASPAGLLSIPLLLEDIPREGAPER